MFEEACCFKTPVSVSLNRLSSPSPPFLFLFHPSHFLSLVSSRRVTVMIRGRCGTRTPRGAPTTTGRPTQRAPRLGRLLLTPGALHPRAIRRLTRVQVRKSFDCLIAAFDLVLCIKKKKLHSCDCSQPRFKTSEQFTPGNEDNAACVYSLSASAFKLLYLFAV